MQGDGVLIWIGLALIPYVYVLVRFAAEGWFGARLNYQRRLLDFMKGDTEHGS